MNGVWLVWIDYGREGGVWVTHVFADHEAAIRERDAHNSLEWAGQDEAFATFHEFGAVEFTEPSARTGQGFGEA